MIECTYSIIIRWSQLIISLASIIVKNAYFMFEYVDFGYDWYFMLSLFKFLHKKVVPRSP